MNPNALYPHPDANSSSLAYLYDPPPGTDPNETPDPALNPAPPQLRNRAQPQRAPLSPTQDLMDVDTGTDTSGAARDTSPDHTPGRGLKRARPDTGGAEMLEHSEPVCKQRRTDSPEPTMPAIYLSPEATQKALREAVTEGKLDRLQSLVNQTENIDQIFDGDLWEVAATHGHLAIIDWLSKQADRLDLPKPHYIKLFEIAADHGQIDVLQWLARQGFVTKGVNDDGGNALTLAAKAGQLEIVKYLADHGCNIHQLDRDNDNAVMLAAEAGHLEVVQWLAAHGCNIQQVNKEGDNALIVAAEAGHLELVQWLADYGCNIHQVNNDRYSALNLAAYRGHLELVQWLVAQGCDVQRMNKRGDNALTLAAKAGHLEVVQWLAGQGCNIHQVNKDRDNALILAAKAGHLKVVQWLAGQGRNIQQVNSNRDNTLTIATENGNFEFVQWFTDQGCDIHQGNNDGDNALTLAAQAGHLEIVQWLAGQGCNIQQVNNGRDNALTLAVKAGHLEIVQWLAGQGFDVDLENHNDDTALTLAAKAGHLEIVQWLADQECDIDQVNDDGDNALTLAAKAGHLEIVQWLADQGCNVHQVNDDDENALILAAQEGHLEVVQWLAEKGLNINQINRFGDTAFSLSMQSRHSDVACELIMRGANLMIHLSPDPDGYLFGALDIGNTVLINMLIPRHNVALRSNSGFTPLTLAAQNNLIEVAIPLIRATLRIPYGRLLLHEAFQITTDPLFKELLNNPSLIDEDPSSYSWLSPEGDPQIQTAIVHDYVSSQYQTPLENQLGSGQSMTPMQKKSARIGVLAELPAWKLANRIEKIFNKKLIPSLLPIQKRVATFISEDIEVLATQANGWEENHLVPVIKHLYSSCLMHSFSAYPAIGITNELADKGLYHPIAQRIAAAWTNAWVPVSEEAKPLLLPTPTAQFDYWDLEDLPNLELINGEVVIRPDTLARNIGRFVGTPVGVRLLQAFCVTLKDEFDAVESRILHPDDATLPPESKNLYADLMMRQLHLVAQFWRTQLS